MGVILMGCGVVEESNLGSIANAKYPQTPHGRFQSPTLMAALSVVWARSISIYAHQFAAKVPMLPLEAIKVILPHAMLIRSCKLKPRFVAMEIGLAHAPLSIVTITLAIEKFVFTESTTTRLRPFQ